MTDAVIQLIPKLDYDIEEAFNKLATNITFCGDDMKILLITSCREHEGKSTLCFLTWKKLAEMGYRTLMIDADLRRSIFRNRFRMVFQGDEYGLSHYLTRSGLAVEDAVYRTNIPNGYWIPAGRNVLNSLQLLSGKKLEVMLSELKKEYDYVIIDSPPIGAIVDAATIARCCDGAMLVVRHNSTTKQEVLYAKDQIEKSGCPVLGTILNDVSMNCMSSRYYNQGNYSAYKLGYYSDTAHKRNVKRTHRKYSKRFGKNG